MLEVQRGEIQDEHDKRQTTEKLVNSEIFVKDSHEARKFLRISDLAEVFVPDVPVPARKPFHKSTYSPVNSSTYSVDEHADEKRDQHQKQETPDIQRHQVFSKAPTVDRKRIQRRQPWKKVSNDQAERCGRDILYTWWFHGVS